MEGKYKPTLKSVKKHQVPEWYHDAKFGIFIHWSLSSVPAFAPTGRGDIKQLVSEGGLVEHRQVSQNSCQCRTRQHPPCGLRVHE